MAAKRTRPLRQGMLLVAGEEQKVQFELQASPSVVLTVQIVKRSRLGCVLEVCGNGQLMVHSKTPNQILIDCNMGAAGG